MVTARDIITAALQDAGVTGVGQTPSGEDMNDALFRLNNMLGQWNRQRWLVFHTVDVTCISNGNISYTVGLGGNFNIARPDRLETGCFVRQLNGIATTSGSDFNNDFSQDFGPLVPASGNFIDYPLALIEAQEDYNKIALKSLSTWPSCVFYDAAMTMGTPIGGNPSGTQYPYGNARFYPVPAAGQFEIHLLVKDVLQTISNLSADILMPPEYVEALQYNLAQRLCLKYQLPLPPELAGFALAALETIRGANFKIPMLQLPARLIGQGDHYNIYSDQSY